MTTLDLIREDVLTAGSLREALDRIVVRLRESVAAYTWVGVYVVDGDELVLSAWSGTEETEHTRIPVGQGICGLAASSGRTIVVPDVSEDERYLMCFPSTRSEIVVPIRKDGVVLGEIDIDSDRLDAFSQEDRGLLEAVAGILSERF